MTTRIRTSGRAAIAIALGTSLLLAGCGDDEGDTAATTTTEASAPASSTEPAEDADGQIVAVDLADFMFEGLPDSVPVGTRLTITNSSEAELHELVALRLPDDEQRTVEELAQLPEEELEGLFPGPPATVLLAKPGGEQIDALGDGTLSEPGRYAVICAIPTGVDPDEYLEASESSEGAPEVPGAGPPHFTQGMVAELLVE